MKILLDQGTPTPLRHHLTSHEVATAYEMSWDKLSNGDLISEAERNGFGLLITTDQNLRYQQNLVSRKISILVLLTTSWPRIQGEIDLIILEVNNITSGSYKELKIS
ncbi:MAG: hypothetical protein PHD76_04585 [Methylacidiphilales bacterium]|nr:hypothetical protein [Candidatus Methylacidiphilales bacterium]